MEQLLERFYAELVSPFVNHFEKEQAIANVLTTYIARDLVSITLVLAADGTREEKNEVVRLGIQSIVKKCKEIRGLKESEQEAIDQLLTTVFEGVK